MLIEKKEFFKGFLLLFIVDMIVIPILAVLELGISVNITSNYFARYIYLFVFALTILFHLLTNKNLKLNIVSLSFLIFLPIGIILGLVQGKLGREFVVHIYTCLMPIIAVSFGWYLMEEYLTNTVFRAAMHKVLYIIFIVGVLASLWFRVNYYLGHAAYNAIGIWNYTFATPYFLLSPDKSLMYTFVSIIGSLLAGKRIGILILGAYLFIYILMIRANFTRKLRIILAGILGCIILMPFLMESDLLDRIAYTVNQIIVAADFDAASAGRVSEIFAVFSYIMKYPANLLFGSGFGSNVMVFEGYYRHYSHFGPLSYTLIGGIPLTIIIYGFLFWLGFSLISKINQKIIPKEGWFFVLILWGIIVSSMTGAVLTNYTTLWIFIGCAWRLNKQSQGNMGNY